MIKLYGVPASRAFRSLWALEEIGVEYELVTTNFIDDVKKPEYLAINPNGKVPVLVDGDTVIWESNAIMAYLADQAGSDLWPKDARQIDVLRWLELGCPGPQLPRFIANPERCRSPAPRVVRRRHKNHTYMTRPRTPQRKLPDDQELLSI